MTQHHISVIDWAFRVFMSNYDNEEYRRCKIGKIYVGNKTIDPKMFIRKKDEKREGVWG